MPPTSPEPLHRTLMTVAEVASALRVSKMTIYRLIRSGELPAMRIGRSFRVSEAAYHTYLNSLA